MICPKCKQETHGKVRCEKCGWSPCDEDAPESDDDVPVKDDPMVEHSYWRDKR
jgi:hypothetical protein